MPQCNPPLIYNKIYRLPLQAGTKTPSSVTGHTPQSALCAASSPNLGEQQKDDISIPAPPLTLEGVDERSSDGGVCHVVEECVKQIYVVHDVFWGGR